MGEALVVRGGRRLYGAADVPAAKNSVLPLLAASLLCDGSVRLHRAPRLSDVENCLSILRSVGCTAHWMGRDILVRTGSGLNDRLPDEQVGAMRASVLFMAPLLARTGRVETGMPGGCKLGPRPIDIHLDGLVHMGASIKWGTQHLTLEVPRGLHGADYTLRYPSVGATETLLLAAATARGTTVLRGTACEPEIVDLAAFLTACGANIAGAGSPVIKVSGARRLTGTDFTPIPDRIVASTLACAVASAGGEAVIRRCDPFIYAPLLTALKQAGCAVDFSAQNEVTIRRRGALNGIGRVFTGVYPGLATDAAPLLAAALLCAEGESSVEDTVFENRFSCAAGFAAMGAAVKTEGRALIIHPCGGLHGTTVASPDLRGGAALAVAALAAPEPSYIENAATIARGYEDLAALLRRLGAKAG